MPKIGYAIVFLLVSANYIFFSYHSIMGVRDNKSLLVAIKAVEILDIISPTNGISEIRDLHLSNTPRTIETTPLIGDAPTEHLSTTLLPVGSDSGAEIREIDFHIEPSLTEGFPKIVPNEEMKQMNEGKSILMKPFVPSGWNNRPYDPSHFVVSRPIVLLSNGTLYGTFPAGVHHGSGCGIEDLCDLIIVTAAHDNFSKDNPWRMVIEMFRVFQTHYRFRGIVFTDSPVISAYAREREVQSARYPVLNQFRMPFLKPMMDIIHQNYKSKYIGYVNSDIMMGTSYFDLLDFISFARSQKVIANNVLLAASPVDRHKTSVDFGSLVEYDKSIGTKLKGSRGIYSADIFIFNSECPLDYLSDLVIARAGVDNVVMSFAKIVGGDYIDIHQQAVLTVHLGQVNHRTRTRELQPLDSKWNFMVNKMKYYELCTSVCSTHVIRKVNNEFQLYRRSIRA